MSDDGVRRLRALAARLPRRKPLTIPLGNLLADREPDHVRFWVCTWAGDELSEHDTLDEALQVCGANEARGWVVLQREYVLVRETIIRHDGSEVRRG